MLDMLAIHEAARCSPSPVYHEFLGRYVHSAKRVYAFVEGRDDYSYYTQAIEAVLPDDWDVDVWPAGNKDAVLALHRELDWDRFSRDRVLLFVDRDLADFLAEKHPRSKNLYVTPHYSIENDLVTRSCCKSLLNEVCGLGRCLTQDEMDVILGLFDEELERFSKYIVQIMAWVLAWRRNEHRPCLNDVQIAHLVTINAGKVIVRRRPDGKRGLTSYLQGRLKMPTRGLAAARDAALNDFDGVPFKKYVRGKYELWFLWAFVTSIHENAGHFCAALKGRKVPGKRVGVGANNMIVVIGPRARKPQHLFKFLRRRLGSLN